MFLAGILCAVIVQGKSDTDSSLYLLHKEYLFKCYSLYVVILIFLLLFYTIISIC